jgi:hypothetical protein
LLAAQKPKMMVAITPPNEKMRMGASPPSSVVPTRSPTFLAYRRRGPLHCGHLKPTPCSSKKRPAHSACKWERTNNSKSGYHSRQDQPQRGRGETCVRLNLFMTRVHSRCACSSWCTIWNESTYGVVDVATVLADPFSFPEPSRDACSLGPLQQSVLRRGGRRLLVPEDVQCGSTRR